MNLHLKIILLIHYLQDKLPAIKEKKRKDEDDEPGEKWVARNWTKKDTKGMSLAEKSRYLAVRLSNLDYIRIKEMIQ